MKSSKNELKYSPKGITLISLVVTIIILLILAGVSIALLVSDNGIISQAIKAKEQTEIGDEKEKISLSVAGALLKNNGGELKRNFLNEELTNYIGTENTDYTLSESTPFIVKYLDSGRSYQIDENGNVSEYVPIDISEYVKIGDYVNYNPTVLDKNGTSVEASKLTYTSPTGSGTEHGNGYADQVFTAKSDVKWRVLSIENDTVQLISENVIATDTDSNFIMNGVMSYLYIEQEANEICKIYGYGYGADTSQTTKYSYGGPLDGTLTGQITGSGARSITIEDINKILAIYKDSDGKMKFRDGTVINEDYGNSENPTINLYYPTVTTSTGESELPGAKNLIETGYTYNAWKACQPYYEYWQLANLVDDLLLEGYNYWLASRAINTSANSCGFYVRAVRNNEVRRKLRL